MIGERILNYKVEALLGEGGVGSVYLATHIQLGRKVAIKVLNPALVNHTEVRERFRQEATTLSSLQHINIVTLYDYLEDERGLFLIMEYVPGNSLENYIRKVSGPIPEQKTIYFFNQILDGLAYAHQKGIVHRDIKPSNIIITSDADAKILDFGIAKILKDGKGGMTKTGTRMGTVLYMSPEQVKGQNVDVRTDIYALGVTLFEMLTGQCPYNEHTTSEFEIYNKIVLEPLPRLKQVYPAASDRMQLIIDKATAKDPQQRFQTCEEFRQALHNIAYGSLGYTNPTINQTLVNQPITDFQQNPQNQFSNTFSNQNKEEIPEKIIKPKSNINKERERTYTFLYILLGLMLMVCVYFVANEFMKGGQTLTKDTTKVEEEEIDEPKPKIDEPEKDPEKTPEEIALDTLEEAKKKTEDLIKLIQKDKKAEFLKSLAADAQLEDDEVDLKIRVTVINRLTEVKFKDIVVAINFYNDADKLVKTREQELEPLKEKQSISFRITESNKDLKYKVSIKSAEPFDFELPPSLDSLNKEIEKIEEKIEELKKEKPSKDN